MSIGGVDIVLWASEKANPADLILRVCRRQWPQGIFQDADEVSTRALNDAGDWFGESVSAEFFVFRDAGAAESWARLGASPEHENTMLHFLINESFDKDKMNREVTVVCDSPQGEVLRILDELRASFLDKSYYPKFERGDAA